MAKRKMPTQKVEYHGIYAPTKGLYYNSSMPSTMVDEHYTPSCAEVVMDNGLVQTQTGTSIFGDTSNTPLSGSVMHIDQFYDSTGNDKLMAHTSNDVYYYDTTLEHFQNITSGVVVEDCEDSWVASASVTCSADTTYYWRGSKSAKAIIAVAFTTGLAAYEDFAAKNLTTYTNLHFLIRSSVATDAADLQILLDDTGGCVSATETLDVPALTADTWTECSVAFVTPANLTAIISVGLNVAVDKGAQTVYIDDVRAVDIETGDEDNVYSSEIMSDLYIYNNGIAADTIKKWDMATATVTNLLNATDYRAKKLLAYGERLCLFHTIESGVTAPQRVRWSVVGDPEDFAGAGASYATLIGVIGVDYIQTAEKISNYVAIYAERTIALMEYRGTDATNPFHFITRVAGVGIAAPQAIVNLDEEHIFLGWDNVYSYKGGRDVEPIGNNIQEELFSIIEPEFINRSFMVFIEEKNEVRLYIPTIGNETPNTYFALNIKTNGWSRGTRNYTGYGYFSQQDSPIWDTAEGTWAEATARWDDRTRLNLSPINLFGNTSGEVWQDNDSIYTVEGSDVTSWWDSKDLVVSDRYVGTVTNWMGVIFEAIGESVDIWISIDFGANYRLIKTETLTSSWTKYKVDFEAWSPQVRIRFRSTSGWWRFRHFEVSFVRGSDR